MNITKEEAEYLNADKYEITVNFRKQENLKTKNNWKYILTMTTQVTEEDFVNKVKESVGAFIRRALNKQTKK